MPNLPIPAPERGTFLTRIAAVGGPEEPEQGLSTAQKGLMGAAAVAPFAGLIGQQPIIHDPLQGAEGKAFRSMKHLGQQARVGDVILTSKPTGSMFKNFITPAGNSQFYHAQPVTSVQDGMGYTQSAGDLVGQKLKPTEALDYAHNIPDYFKDPDTMYDSAVLLRPKQPLTPSQLKVLQRDYGQRVQRPYDNKKALGTFFRDLFVPKIDAIANTRPDVVCEGNVCSTMPAMSYHKATGRRVVPGKPAQDTFPTDFLRSNEFDMVGHHISPEVRAVENKFLRKAGPLAMRAGLGAAGAGAAYAATENPETVAAVPGAVLANRYMDSINSVPKTPDEWTNIPRFDEMFGEMQGGKFQSPEAKAARGRFLTRRIPGILAGGALGYGAAHLAHKGIDHLRGKSEKKPKHTSK